MKNDLAQKLKEVGLRSTQPRSTILKALSEQKHPESISQIHEALKKKGIDLVTLYRTIESFENAGIVKRIELRQDVPLYELSHGHHHHIVCTDCGTIEDFKICEMEALSKKIATRASKFKAIKDHSLELFGICNICIKK